MKKELTDREMQTLEYMSQGMSNFEISLKLKISKNTVKNHVSSVLRKMNANNRTHAVVKALKKEIVEL
ncbi:MAG: response regulator transcription factor [Bacillota bacterium]